MPNNNNNNNILMSSIIQLRRQLSTMVVSSSSSSESDSTSTTTTTGDETTFEMYSDLLLGLAFLITAFIAGKRMYINSRQLAAVNAASAAMAGTATGANGGRSASSNAASPSGGAETTVVTAFYSLILATSILRAVWFVIPILYSMVMTSLSDDNADYIQYTPVAVNAWDTTQTPSWMIYAMSEMIVTAGSLTLFSIFILILVYWADILKKYYNPGSRRSLPMVTFLGLVGTLCALELVNLAFFLLGFYSTEGMILFNAILLSVVSIICVCEITIFSRKFQNVLKTLGAINQVSTDSQIKRIVWITVTGNLFFFTRALLETVFSSLLVVYWFQYHSVNRVFTHTWWDTYTFVKYWSEITILALMLHILQSRFSNSASGGAGSGSRQQQQQQASLSNAVGYTKVPDASVNV